VGGRARLDDRRRDAGCYRYSQATRSAAASVLRIVVTRTARGHSLRQQGAPGRLIPWLCYSLLSEVKRTDS
jgi:hypothetical protein